MATAITMTFPPEWTAADWQERLGGVPLRRIRMYPRPGLAVPQDVLDIHHKTGSLCELVDGVLVEKPMGYHESQLAGAMLFFLWTYLRANRVGTAAGADGMLEILPNVVRIPDVSFIRWERMPAGDPGPIPAVAPDLAIEILSPNNTPAEMDRKLREYFAAGARLVWHIDPATRTARAFTAPDESVLVTEEGILCGGDVLPGFELPLKDLFAAVERPTE